MPGPGVGGAAQPAVAAHPARALLVAGQAGADPGRIPGPGPGREVRVGDLPADHPTRSHCPSASAWSACRGSVIRPAPDHGDVHRGADRGRHVHGVAGGRAHAGHDHVQGGRGHANRGADVVHRAGGAGHPGHLDRLAEGGAALDQLVAAEPHAECQAGPDRRAHRGHHLQQQPGAGRQRPAVPVGALVRGRGQETPDDRGLRALQFHAVEPALGAVPGDAGVAGHDLRDLVRLDRLGHLAEQRVGDRARRLHREPGVHPGGLAAVVVQLGQDRDPVRVHRVGEAPVAGDHLGPVALDQLLVRPVRRVGGVLLGDDQPGPAGRAARVVRGVLPGGQPVARVVGQVGGEHHPVGQRQRAHPQRGEQVPVRPCAHRPCAHRPVLTGPALCSPALCSSAQLAKTALSAGATSV